MEHTYKFLSHSIDSRIATILWIFLLLFLLLPLLLLLLFPFTLSHFSPFHLLLLLLFPFVYFSPYSPSPPPLYRSIYPSPTSSPPHNLLVTPYFLLLLLDFRIKYHLCQYIRSEQSIFYVVALHFISLRIICRLPQTGEVLLYFFPTYMVNPLQLYFSNLCIYRE